MIWQTSTIMSGFLFACTNLIIKYLTNLQVKPIDIVTILGLTYGLFSLIYVLKTKNYLRYIEKDKRIVFFVILLLALIHIGADFFFDTAIDKSPNPGYVTSISYSFTIIFVFLFSIMFYKSKFNAYSVLGILLIVLGIYLVMVLSNNPPIM